MCQLICTCLQTNLTEAASLHPGARVFGGNMKRIAAALPFLLLVVSTFAFSQGGFFATVTGTVTDTSNALLPGVTVKATAVDTAVVTTTVTNDAGAYTFSNLLPGKYTLSASLPGFQTKNITDIQLSQNTQYRFNFQLNIADVNTQVEVSVSGQDVLATSGATVGQVLPEQKVRDLPLVGNNVLDLITVMSGVENIAGSTTVFGRENTTFAGISASNITVARDGIMVQDVRYPTGINSATTINPDLVGEVRLILAPVDAEIGRGNGTIQIATRSGTNRYTGSAVWTVRNTALDPNSWGNNRNQTLAPGSPPGTVPQAIEPDWSNTHQGTVSFGGPIIRNRTFFFGLFDFNTNHQRSSTQTTVLTPCARRGIFRYYDNWNSGNVFTQASPVPAPPPPAPPPIRPSVNVNGMPVAPTTNPNGSPHNGILRHISVFGPLSSQPTTADCSDLSIPATLDPNAGGAGWDPFRTQIDTTGFIGRTLAYMPLPNNYETGDGLNTAGFRWLRHFEGLDNLWGIGEATGNRKQYNVKIDHNLTDNHKANVNVTYERVSSDDVLEAWPNTFSNENFRHPLVITAGFTSTLSSSLLNEARFGIRKTGTNVVAPWDISENQAALAQYFPPPNDGFLIMPRFQNGLPFCYPHSGVRPPGGCGLGFFGSTAAVTNSAIDNTPVYTYADTLSWNRGNHAFKFGAEARFSSSDQKQSGAGFFSDYQNFVQVHGGSIFGTAPPTSGSNVISPDNPVMSGIAVTDATNARNLMGWLAASLGSGPFGTPPIAQFYFLTDPNQTTWSDYRTDPFFRKKIKQKELTFFAKDDYKVTKDLTLNLGMRWEYYGVPYADSGLTVAPVGGGFAAFGISGRDFTGWMNPGVRGDVTSMEFVGPNSPNPDKSIYKKDFNNFGPAIGFAWQVPWFGAGRTTVRGGYQVTYQGGGRFDELQNGAFVGPTLFPGPLGAPPGSTYSAGLFTQGVYLDLTSVAANVPIPVPVAPMQPVPLSNRTTPFSVFDPNYVAPYIQNLTLSVTRSVSRNVTVDLRYVGTLARKQRGVMNLNAVNFLYNGLLDEFNRVRTGTEITKAPGDPLSQLDQILRGMNLCGSGPPTCAALPAGQAYGAIGTTTTGGYQSAALQLRSHTSFQDNLANGNFVGLASTLNTLSDPSFFIPVNGSAIARNGFPDNLVATNPQFGALGYFTNINYSNYHAFQAQVSMRPVHGLSGQATYSWSRNLGLGTVTNPVDRAADYTNIGNNPGHSLRTNATMELPLGPNKLFFGNTSGWVARAIERWQLGIIYNLSTGAPTSVTATPMLYDNGLPDIVYDFDLNEMKGVRWDIPNGPFLEGRYFDNNDRFVKVADPQCTTVTTLQGLNANNRCTLTAVAMAVDAGTAGAVNRTFPDGQVRPSVIVLQHPQPGRKGSLGNNTVVGLGSWRFDANLGKTFQISESKSLQIRFDAQNVLNHPQPNVPSLTINGAGSFGQITDSFGFAGTTYAKTGGRMLQGQLRLNF